VVVERLAHLTKLLNKKPLPRSEARWAERNNDRKEGFTAETQRTPRLIFELPLRALRDSVVKSPTPWIANCHAPLTVENLF
jgi:hypothetical protein